jgi:hypothetical protein
MALVLPVLAIVLVAVSLALSLAHALELPGKLRLSKDAYLTTQSSIILGLRLVVLPSPPRLWRRSPCFSSRRSAARDSA